MKRIDKKQGYEIIKDIIIPLVEIVITIFVAVYANKIATEANIINRKSEPLIYEIVESDCNGTYSINYNGEEFEIPFKFLNLKIEQGVIDEIHIFLYNGENFTIFEDTSFDFMKQLRMSDDILAIEARENLTSVYNGICYDYFFVYIKSGDGTERVDLAYKIIDLNNKIVSNTAVANKMCILQLENKDKENLAYYEMLAVYKKVQDMFLKILNSDIKIY